MHCFGVNFMCGTLHEGSDSGQIFGVKSINFTVARVLLHSISHRKNMRWTGCWQGFETKEQRPLYHNPDALPPDCTLIPRAMCTYCSVRHHSSTCWGSSVAGHGSSIAWTARQIGHSSGTHHWCLCLHTFIRGWNINGLSHYSLGLRLSSGNLIKCYTFFRHFFQIVLILYLIVPCYWPH